MGRPSRYSHEVGERADRMVFEQQREYDCLRKTRGSSVKETTTMTQVPKKVTKTIARLASLAWLVYTASLSLPTQAQAQTGICGRTPIVRDFILARLDSVTACGDVAAVQLAAITGSLDFANQGIRSLQAGDFDDLINLQELSLRVNDLTTLPVGLFRGLSGLQGISLSDNDLTTLPVGVFRGLSSLQGISLSDNDLTTLPVGVFRGLSSLQGISLSDNDLTTLPADLLRRLSSLRGLDLAYNDLTTLPATLFRGLSSLQMLNLAENDLTTLPATLFHGVPNLQVLDLSFNDLTTLPLALFRGLSNLRWLYLFFNDLTTLPAALLNDLQARGRFLYVNLEGNPGYLGPGTFDFARNWDQSFLIPDRGGQSITSSGTAATMQVVGYGGIRAELGSTTPSGIAIFQFRDSDGVLIAEAGVPATEPVLGGRIFAEVNGPVNTGLAIANPNDRPAFIQFYFTDTRGTRFAEGSFELGARLQTAKFLDQAPFVGGRSVVGTLTFTASVPIAVVALRGLTNEAGEFLMTTLPVAPLLSPPSPFYPAADTVYFPHFADGGGWTTQVILVNPTDRTITGTVGFLGPGSGPTVAAPVVLTLDDGSTGSNFDYSIAPRSAQRFTTANPPGGLAVGSVRATPNSGNDAPSGLVVFSFASGGKTVSEAGVPALPKGSAFRVYVEASGMPDQAGSIRSGLAIANAGDTSNTVTLEVTRLDGSLAVPPATLALPPSGQIARFIDEIFSLPDNFSGVVRVSSAADVATVGLRLRVNVRGELKVTTTPPSNEMGPSTTAETFFPHIVDSGGWSTQFALFSGTPGQASAGTLAFIDASGQPLELITTTP